MVLGLDVGGTKLAAGVAEPDGTLHSRLERPTGREDGPDDVIARLEELGQRAIDQAGVGGVDVVGVGIGGPLDAERGVIQDPPNLPGWHDIPLGERLRATFERPVHIENDANAAALAEHRYGAGRGVDNLVYLTISTGIGGGIIVGGLLYEGESGNAGEIGHMSVAYDRWPCVCGRRGCPEAFASGTNIARRAREALAAGEPSVLAHRAEVTARDVADAARSGDALARRIWDETIEVLVAVIVNVLNVFNPALVILGGGVTRAGDLLFAPLRERALPATLGRQGQDARIVPAALGEDTGILGAVAVALSRAGTPDGAVA